MLVRCSSWKQLLTPTPALLPAPSSSLSASSVSSVSSAFGVDASPGLVIDTARASARQRHHPLPFSQLGFLQLVEAHGRVAGTRYRLYECKHCLYPMLAAALHPTTAAIQSGEAATAPVLSFDGGSGAVLLDGQRVQTLHVLAELRQSMVDDTAAASYFSKSNSATAIDHGFEYDRRHKALLDNVA